MTELFPDALPDLDPQIKALRAAAEKARDTRVAFLAAHKRDHNACEAEDDAQEAADEDLENALDDAGGVATVLLTALDRLADAERAHELTRAMLHGMQDGAALRDTMTLLDRERACAERLAAALRDLVACHSDNSGFVQPDASVLDTARAALAAEREGEA